MWSPWQQGERLALFKSGEWTKGCFEVIESSRKGKIAEVHGVVLMTRTPLKGSSVSRRASPLFMTNINHSLRCADYGRIHLKKLNQFFSHIGRLCPQKGLAVEEEKQSCSVPIDGHVGPIFQMVVLISQKSKLNHGSKVSWVVPMSRRVCWHSVISLSLPVETNQ